ncbi:MAG: AAA+ family ATPase, partial [Firmicutes bacterium]|nr:AAA+ family ATPase [Bacillota bacterium]
RAGQNVAIAATDPSGLLVRPEAARRQLDVEQARVGPDARATGAAATAATPVLETQDVMVTPAAVPTLPRRFHGSVALDALRVGADAGKVAQEVIAHLTSLRGAQVRITLEVEAVAPDGIPEQVVRTVTENCRTLKFSTHGFERD